MDEAAELDCFLPLSFKSPQEQEYLALFVLVVLVPKLHLGTRLLKKLRFEWHQQLRGGASWTAVLFRSKTSRRNCEEENCTLQNRKL